MWLLAASPATEAECLLLHNTIINASLRSMGFPTTHTGAAYETRRPISSPSTVRERNAYCIPLQEVIRSISPVGYLLLCSVRRARRAQRILQWFDSVNVKIPRQHGKPLCTAKSRADKHQDGFSQVGGLRRCGQAPKPILKKSQPSPVSINGSVRSANMLLGNPQTAMHTQMERNRHLSSDFPGYSLFSSLH